MLERQKAVAVGYRGGCGSCVAVFFFLLLLFSSDDKLAKGGGDTAVSSFSSVELSHTATSSAKLGKVCATLSLSRRRSFMQKSCDLPNAIGGLNCTISLFSKKTVKPRVSAFQPRKLTDEIIINQDGIKWN